MHYLKKEIIYSALLSIIFAVMTFIVLIIAGLLFQHITLLNDNNTIMLCVSFFTYLISIGLFNYLSEIAYSIVNVRFSMHHIPIVWHNILSLPLSSLNRLDSAHLYQIISNYESATSTILSTLLNIFNCLVLFILFILYMLYCHPYLGIIYCLTYASLILLKIIFFPLYRKLSDSHDDAHAKSAFFLQESLSQIYKIRTSNSENIIRSTWLKTVYFSHYFLSKCFHIEAGLWLIDTACPALLILVFYCLLYFNPNPDTSHLFPLIICAAQLTALYERLSPLLSNLTNAANNFNRMNPLLSLDIPPKQSIPISNQLNGMLALSQVSCGKLHNISLTIEPGSFIAITGPSGSGKSSLLRLLLGLNDNYTGEITIDNLNIKYLDMSAIRQQFGVVLQTTSLFPGTIYSNITINTKLTLDDAWQLAKQVGLADEISRMPMKMFTHVSDHAGDSLSGGQKQKILIARALATQPKILLLDEATSSLDTLSQKMIFDYLKLLNITRIVVTHRLSTITDADAIYHLENGQLSILK